MGVRVRVKVRGRGRRNARVLVRLTKRYGCACHARLGPQVDVEKGTAVSGGLGQG